MSELKIKGGRRRARLARGLTWLGIYVMRYGTGLATISLLGLILDLLGIVALHFPRTAQLLFIVGMVLVSRLLGVMLFALAGTLVPRARPLLSSALVLLPSTAHTRRPVDRSPEEAG
jgi:hypothetical protein